MISTSSMYRSDSWFNSNDWRHSLKVSDPKQSVLKGEKFNLWKIKLTSHLLETHLIGINQVNEITCKGREPRHLCRDYNNLRILAQVEQKYWHRIFLYIANQRSFVCSDVKLLLNESLIVDIGSLKGFCRDFQPGLKFQAYSYRDPCWCRSYLAQIEIWMERKHPPFELMIGTECEWK